MVTKNGHALYGLNKTLLNTKEVVLAAVTRDGEALMYASDDLQNDRDVVLAAVKRDGSALEFASDDLQNDKEVVLAAVREDGDAVRWTDELWGDKDVALAAVTSNGLALKMLGDLRDDKDVVLAAVSENALALKDASDRLKDDPDVVARATSPQNRGNFTKSQVRRLTFMLKRAKTYAALRKIAKFIHSAFGRRVNSWSGAWRDVVMLQTAQNSRPIPLDMFKLFVKALKRVEQLDMKRVQTRPYLPVRSAARVSGKATRSGEDMEYSRLHTERAYGNILGSEPIKRQQTVKRKLNALWLQQKLAKHGVCYSGDEMDKHGPRMKEHMRPLIRSWLEGRCPNGLALTYEDRDRSHILAVVVSPRKWDETLGRFTARVWAINTMPGVGNFDVAHAVKLEILRQLPRRARENWIMAAIDAWRWVPQEDMELLEQQGQGSISLQSHEHSGFCQHWVSYILFQWGVKGKAPADILSELIRMPPAKRYKMIANFSAQVTRDAQLMLAKMK